MTVQEIPLFKVHMPESVSRALEPVLTSGRIADGDQVRSFEAVLGQYLGNHRIVAMSDYSGSITLALFLAGVRPDDEVIVSPMICTGTTMPIANMFARPVWCDVDPMTGIIDLKQVAPLITRKTKALILYHWSGDVGDLDLARELTNSHDLTLIEDASEAFGAEYKGKRLGSHGVDFTVFSFYAVKQITTVEGAALATSQDDSFEKARWLKRYGIHQPSFRTENGDLAENSDIPVAGYNFYMNNVAAAVGLEQMKSIDTLVARYRDNGSFYDRELQGVQGLQVLQRRPDSASGYWTYSFLAESRDSLLKKLLAHGIRAQRLHVRNDRYTCFPPSTRQLPGVDYFDARNISIPCGWWVTEEDRARVVDCIKSGW